MKCSEYLWTRCKMLEMLPGKSDLEIDGEMTLMLHKNCDIRLPKAGGNPTPAIRIEKGNGTSRALELGRRAGRLLKKSAADVVHPHGFALSFTFLYDFGNHSAGILQGLGF